MLASEYKTEEQTWQNEKNNEKDPYIHTNNTANEYKGCEMICTFYTPLLGKTTDLK